MRHLLTRISACALVIAFGLVLSYNQAHTSTFPGSITLNVVCPVNPWLTFDVLGFAPQDVPAGTYSTGSHQVTTNGPIATMHVAGESINAGETKNITVNGMSGTAEVSSDGLVVSFDF